MSKMVRLASALVAYFASLVDLDVSAKRVESAVNNFLTNLYNSASERYKAFLSVVSQRLQSIAVAVDPNPPMVARATSDSLFLAFNRAMLLDLEALAATLPEERIAYKAPAPEYIPQVPYIAPESTLALATTLVLPDSADSAEVAEKVTEADHFEIAHTRTVTVQGKRRRNIYKAVVNPVPGNLYFYKEGRKWVEKMAPQTWQQPTAA